MAVTLASTEPTTHDSEIPPVYLSALLRQIADDIDALELRRAPIGATFF
jgi:hypothetical protein